MGLQHGPSLTEQQRMLILQLLKVLEFARITDTAGYVSRQERLIKSHLNIMPEEQLYLMNMTNALSASRNLWSQMMMGISRRRSQSLSASMSLEISV